VLCCAVLCCAALRCAALHCTALRCAALHCTVLYCTVLYCTVLLPPGDNPFAVNKYIRYDCILEECITRLMTTREGAENVIINKVSCNFILFNNMPLLCGCDSYVCVCLCVYIYIYNLWTYCGWWIDSSCGLQPIASSMLITWCRKHVAMDLQLTVVHVLRDLGVSLLILWQWRKLRIFLWTPV
jgi:hypothetical protein